MKRGSTAACSICRRARCGWHAAMSGRSSTWHWVRRAAGRPRRSSSATSAARSIPSMARSMSRSSAPANAVAGFQQLELNAAVRHDRYSDVGRTTNPRFGLNWSPVRGLTIRAQLQHRLPRADDPGNLWQQQQSVQPELRQSGWRRQYPRRRPVGPESRSEAGNGDQLVGRGGYRAAARASLVNVTYFDVDYATRSPPICPISRSSAAKRNSPGTGIILRGAAAAARVQELLNQGIAPVGAFPGGNPANVTVFVDGRSQNLARSITRGIDFNIVYRTRHRRERQSDLRGVGHLSDDYRVALTPAAPLIDQRNLIFRPLTFRARASVTWDHGPLSARLLASHVGGYTNNVADRPAGGRAATRRSTSRSPGGSNESGIASSLDDFSISAGGPRTCSMSGRPT